MQMRQQALLSPIGAVLSANQGLHLAPVRPRFCQVWLPSAPPSVRSRAFPARRRTAFRRQSEQTGAPQRTAVARRRPFAPLFAGQEVKHLNAPRRVSPRRRKKHPCPLYFAPRPLSQFFGKLGFGCGPTRMGSPPRRDAIHRVSHRPDGPLRGRMSRRGIRPERVRRDESLLYAGKFPCGRTSATGEDHAARPTPPSGANYSITAGKRSAPAESRHIYMWAP